MNSLPEKSGQTDGGKDERTKGWTEGQTDMLASKGLPIQIRRDSKIYSMEYKLFD